MYYVNQNHKNAFLKLMTETNYFDDLIDDYDFPPVVGIACFYLLTSQKVMDEVGFVRHLDFVNLYLDYKMLKRMQESVTDETKMIIDVAIRYIRTNGNVDAKMLLNQWASIRNMRTKRMLQQSLRIVASIKTGDNGMFDEEEDGFNRMKKGMTYGAIQFVDDEHKRTFTQLRSNCLLLSEIEGLDYQQEQFDPVLYILSVGKVRRQIDFIESEDELIRFFENEEWLNLKDGLKKDVYQLLLLASHLWDAVFPFQLDDFIRSLQGLEDLLVLKEAVRLKHELTNYMAGRSTFE
jgi:hypothetical protein